MADFQDLEDLAKDISEGRSYSEKVPSQGPAEETKADTVTEEKVVVIPSKEGPKPERRNPRRNPSRRFRQPLQLNPRSRCQRKKWPGKSSPRQRNPRSRCQRKKWPGKWSPRQRNPKKEETRKPEAAEEEEEVSGEKGKKKGLFSKFFGKKK